MLTWNRKKLTIAGGLLLFFLLCGNCFGQIVMKIELPQKTFLQYEPIYAKVHMRNLAGHTLAFGASKGLAGRLHFEIRRHKILRLQYQCLLQTAEKWTIFHKSNYFPSADAE